jgi:hypothetical protein
MKLFVVTMAVSVPRLIRIMLTIVKHKTVKIGN